MKYVTNKIGIREQTRLEAAEMAAKQSESESEKLFAYIDYVAMMSNIELPETEEEGEFDGEE